VEPRKKKRLSREQRRIIVSQQLTIAIDPVTRIEGHLKAAVVVDDGKVVDAHLTGGMYRGFETILKGRDPRDASQITQRICGVCPVSHALASSMALEKAAGIVPPTNGRLTRNLMQGANYLQSHILSFYHLAGQDFIQGPDTSPFMPRYANPDLRLSAEVNAVGVDEYLEALEVRRVCHEMAALFGGRMPHAHGILAGGTSEKPSARQLGEYASRFEGVRNFVQEKYLPIVWLVASRYKDLCAVAPGYATALCMGVFPLNDEGLEYIFKPGAYYDGKDHPFDPMKVVEYVRYSWFDNSATGRVFSEGLTEVDMDKPQAYSFVKAPRYDDHAMEVGPHARMWVNNTELSPVGKKLAKDYFGLEATHIRDLGEAFVFSIMGRHLARAEEAWIVAEAMQKWLGEVKAGEETFRLFKVPQSAEGFAFTEAPRGSLLHYTRIREGKIDGYQILPATLWNCSPRDDRGQRGPVEQALLGVPVPDAKSPVNVGRLIRAFDP